jgi:mono/diheme cytochrome c family protein
MKQLTIIPALLLMTVLTCTAQDGKQVYSDKCATCHGPDGAAKTARGKQLKVKGAAESAKLSVAELVKIVENGKGVDMPAYAKQLPAPQIQAVTEYFRSLAK